MSSERAGLPPQDADAQRTTDTFSMDCPTCGPSTVHYLNGEQVPHGCDYVPPSVVIDCEDS